MKYKFTRETYKKLKKYDRQEMETFIENLYLKAYEDGKKSVVAENQTEKLSNVLNNTKGVGIKTYDAIMEEWNNARVNK